MVFLKDSLNARHRGNIGANDQESKIKIRSQTRFHQLSGRLVNIFSEGLCNTHLRDNIGKILRANDHLSTFL